MFFFLCEECSMYMHLILCALITEMCKMWNFFFSIGVLSLACALFRVASSMDASQHLIPSSIAYNVLKFSQFTQLMVSE